MADEITVGADPELVCYDHDNERVIDIANTVEEPMGEFGADGHGFTAELRPKAAVYPLDLTENTRIALLKGYSLLSHCSWEAGPYIREKPLGGHVHFGIPASDTIKETLDNMAAIMLGVLEPSETAAIRRNTIFTGRGGYVNNQGKPYGLLGDIKNKPWGFEYRTPSSFIVTPGVTTAMYTLLKALVFEDAIQGPSSWTQLDAATRKALAFKPADLYCGNRAVFLEKLGTLWPILQNLTYFKPGMEGRPLWSSLKYLLQVIEKGGFRAVPDMKDPWKITAAAAAKVTAQRPVPHRRTGQGVPVFDWNEFQGEFLEAARQDTGMLTANAQGEIFRIINGRLVPEDTPAAEVVETPGFQELWGTEPAPTLTWSPDQIWGW